jgi:hypothetical protein
MQRVFVATGLCEEKSAGLAPEKAGLDYLNFEAPANAPPSLVGILACDVLIAAIPTNHGVHRSSDTSKSPKAPTTSELIHER